MSFGLITFEKIWTWHGVRMSCWYNNNHDIRSVAILFGESHFCDMTDVFSIHWHHVLVLKLLPGTQATSLIVTLLTSTCHAWGRSGICHIFVYSHKEICLDWFARKIVNKYLNLSPFSFIVTYNLFSYCTHKH